MIASVCRLARYRAQQVVTRLDTDDCVLDLAVTNDFVFGSDYAHAQHVLAARLALRKPSLSTRAAQKTVFAAATTGPTNVVVTALFRDTQHLYEYLTGPLAALPGVTSVETAPIIRTLKRTGSVP